MDQVYNEFENLCRQGDPFPQVLIKFSKWQRRKFRLSFHQQVGRLPERTDTRVYPRKKTLRNIFDRIRRETVKYVVDQDGIELLCEELEVDPYRGQGQKVS